MTDSRTPFLPPPVIGHRGLARVAPENTLAGVDAAADHGVAWIEVDAKLSADGTVMLMHDDDVARTTNGRGAFAALDDATIAGLDAGGWFGERFRGEPVPRLDTVLDRAHARGLGINIEIKPSPGMARATARAVAETLERAAPPPLLLTSFDAEALAAVATAAPGRHLGWLTERLTADCLDRARRHGCVTVLPGDRNLDLELAERIARHLPVIVWTVNEVDRLPALRDAGVFGVITDEPAVSVAWGAK